MARHNYASIQPTTLDKNVTGYRTRYTNDKEQRKAALFSERPWQIAIDSITLNGFTENTAEPSTTLAVAFMWT